MSGAIDSRFSSIKKRRPEMFVIILEEEHSDDARFTLFISGQDIASRHAQERVMKPLKVAIARGDK